MFYHLFEFQKIRKKKIKKIQKAFLIHYSCCCFFNALRITGSTGDLFGRCCCSLVVNTYPHSSRKIPMYNNLYFHLFVSSLCLFSSLCVQCLAPKRKSNVVGFSYRARTHTHMQTDSRTHTRAHNEPTHARSFDPIVVYAIGYCAHDDGHCMRNFSFCVLSVALTLPPSSPPLPPPPRTLRGVAKVFYSKIDGGTIHQQNNQMRVFIIEWVCFTNMCFVIFC